MQGKDPLSSVERGMLAWKSSDPADPRTGPGAGIMKRRIDPVLLRRPDGFFGGFAEDHRLSLLQPCEDLTDHSLGGPASGAMKRFASAGHGVWVGDFIRSRESPESGIEIVP